MPVYNNGICEVCDSRYQHDVRLSGSMFVPARLNELGYSVCSTRCAATFTLRWIKSVNHQDCVDCKMFKIQVDILNREAQVQQHKLNTLRQSAIQRDIRGLSVDELESIKRVIATYKRRQSSE